MKRVWGSLSPVGVIVGGILLALSLTPSLLPRPAVLQGVGSGVVFGLGYTAGAGASGLLAWLTRWRPSQVLGRRLRIIAWSVLAVVVVLAAVGGVAAQNEVRRMVELAPLDNVNVFGFVVALLLTTLLCLGAGRLVRVGWLRTQQAMVKRGRSPGRARGRQVGAG